MLPIFPLIALFLAFTLLPLLRYERARLLLHSGRLARARLAYAAECEALAREQAAEGPLEG